MKSKQKFIFCQMWHAKSWCYICPYTSFNIQLHDDEYSILIASVTIWIYFLSSSIRYYISFVFGLFVCSFVCLLLLFFQLIHGVLLSLPLYDNLCDHVFSRWTCLLCINWIACIHKHIVRLSNSSSDGVCICVCVCGARMRVELFICSCFDSVAGRCRSHIRMPYEKAMEPMTIFSITNTHIRITIRSL